MTKNQPNDSNDFRARTEGMDAQTVTLSGSGVWGKPFNQPRQSVDEYRRAKADKAIARIEERYQRGLTIPDVR